MFYYLRSFFLSGLFALILQIGVESHRFPQKFKTYINQSIPGSYIHQVATVTATHIQKLIDKVHGSIQKQVQSYNESIERNRRILEERRRRIEEGLDPNFKPSDK